MKLPDLRKAARGHHCLMRFPGCLCRTETVVLCHLPMAGIRGVGQKAPDLCAVWAGDYCHRILDARDMTKEMREIRQRLRDSGEWWEYLYRGLMRTLEAVTREAA